MRSLVKMPGRLFDVEFFEEVSRAEEFSPVKNLTGVDSADSFTAS